MTIKDIDELIDNTRKAMTATFYDVNKEINRSLSSQETMTKSRFSM